MNEIGQYITGIGTAAVVIGGTVAGLTSLIKRALGMSGHAVRNLAMAISFVVGVTIAFLFPASQMTGAGGLDVRMTLGATLFQGFVAGILIALAATGANKLTQEPGQVQEIGGKT